MVTKKQRQRRLARAKWERQQERREQRSRRHRRNGIVIGAVLAVVLVLVGGFVIVQLVRDDPSSASQKADSSPSSSADDKAEDKAGDEAKGECEYIAAGGEGQKSLGRPDAKPGTEITGGSSTATVKTDGGTLELQLDGSAAPCAVNSFTYLAEKKAFQDTECTGVAVAPAKARYLECGDPSGKGNGGPGYMYAKENTKTKVPAGSVVMTGDNGESNGSRFLVTYGSSTFEQPVTVIGTVESGLGVIEKAAGEGLAEGDGKDSGIGRPKAPVVIEDVKVAAATP